MSKSKTKPETARRKPKPSGTDNAAERRQKIAEAAYYKAERRGFSPGRDELDWFEAEKEIDGDRRAR